METVVGVSGIWTVIFNPCPAEPGYALPLQNSVDPDQLASKKPTDLDLHCLSFSM